MCLYQGVDDRGTFPSDDWVCDRAFPSLVFHDVPVVGAFLGCIRGSLYVTEKARILLMDLLCSCMDPWRVFEVLRPDGLSLDAAGLLAEFLGEDDSNGGVDRHDWAFLPDSWSERLADGLGAMDQERQGL